MNKYIGIGLVVVLIIIGLIVVGGEDGATPSYESIHIMTDGSVMLGNGDVVEGAQVTPDGKIKLPNGEILEPVMDMREGETSSTGSGQVMGDMGELVEMDEESEEHDHDDGTHEHEEL